VELSINGNANWCLSGGAVGSDLQWGMTAGKAGHGVIHWSFAGHRSDAPASELIILPAEELLTADPHLKRANETLKRTFPVRPKSKSVKEEARANAINNLLRRNWFQVGFADACYGVSTFSLPDGLRLPIGEPLEQHRQVSGGTAWATQMFIDRHDGKTCACYVFDQEAGYWFQWIGGFWVRIYEPPKPQGIWAGIGTRKLLQVGKIAIRVLMDYERNYHEDV
jgi:hypothetical protein